MRIWGIQLVPQLLLKHPDTLYTQCRHIEHFHEEVWCHKNTFWQNDSVLNLAIFTLLFNKGFVSAQIVHARGNQLVRAFTEAIWYAPCRTRGWENRPDAPAPCAVSRNLANRGAARLPWAATRVPGREDPGDWACRLWSTCNTLLRP